MEVNRVNSITSPMVVQAPSDQSGAQNSPELSQAVTAVNGAKLFGQDSELSFAMDRETKRVVIRLVDKDSRKVIKQIPPKTVMELAQGIAESST